jgi:hypothetical protein
MEYFLDFFDLKSFIDDLVRSPKTVTPAEAGVQNSLNLLDSLWSLSR